MKSEIISSVRQNGSGHEHQKNNLLSVSKKVVMLALLVLGTASFASVKPIAVKGTAAKEISLRKHKKHLRTAKKVEATAAATPSKK